MKIQKYNSESFSQILKDNNIVLVKFSATWCGPCKKLEKEMKNDSTNVLVLSVDVEDEEDFSKNIKTLPTVFFYKNGVKQDKIVTGCDFDKILKIYNKLLDN